MKIDYWHGRAKEEAYQRIEGLLSSLETSYGDQAGQSHRSWNRARDKLDFSFKARGIKVAGSLCLVEDRAVFDIKLPILARALSGKIEEAIRERLDEAFAVP